MEKIAEMMVVRVTVVVANPAKHVVKMENALVDLLIAPDVITKKHVDLIVTVIVVVFAHHQNKLVEQMENALVDLIQIVMERKRILFPHTTHVMEEKN
jgi:hypothetical protein